MRCSTVLAAALAFATPAALPADAKTISEAFREVKASIVVIQTTGVEPALIPGVDRVSVGGLGSGVLIHADGIILTAAHVIQTAEEIEVLFADGQKIKGKVFASDPVADVAVVKLERPPADPVVAPLGDSDKVAVGDQIFIVGAPLGISYTLTVGHISARRTANAVWGGISRAEMFQTDAAINTGNSGGPMFNLDGEVVGIVSSMITRTGGFEGLGFAVTSNMARKLVLEQRPMWSGFEGYTLYGPLAKLFNLPQPVGVMVQRVAKDSPAERLGLRPGSIRATIEGEEIILGGDIILGVAGISLAEENARERIREIVSTLTPGDALSLVVLRGGETVELQAKPLR